MLKQTLPQNNQLTAALGGSTDGLHGQESLKKRIQTGQYGNIPLYPE